MATVSNSYAQPILRTTNLSTALQTVEQLLGIADLQNLEVDFEAIISSTHALASAQEVLPDAEWWTREDERDGSSAYGDDPSAHLPIVFRTTDTPLAVGPFLAAVADSPTTVRWDFNAWPEAPQIGLGRGGTRGAFVTLCANVRDLDLKEPAADHTVFVHVKQREAARAPWLAAQVGLQVIGDLVMAPD
ncbi:hypothetical protein ACFW9L_43160 [Streptomyces sp. NPDC059517]|uniref:hypothetical protein n=1 Tax=Streptomyces sp. NPDC059517 TaxID=3346855 RepID=UPI00368A140F